jgi:Ca2+-transporting ATPase
MGSGCEVAKDNSDLVILDNDFVSIFRSIQWGRQIFNNVRKFLQFQMTVNIVVCFITLLGGMTIGQIPLNIIQLLWTNLIMDVLGAMMEDRYVHSTRVSRKEKLFNAHMWRQILG